MTTPERPQRWRRRPKASLRSRSMCRPNLEDRGSMFAHSRTATAEVIEASTVVGRPMWASQSERRRPSRDRRGCPPRWCRGGGAHDTLLGMVIDTESRRPVLGAQKGGLSGAAMHPVAVRAVFDVHEALPDLPIVGVGHVERNRCRVPARRGIGGRGLHGDVRRSPGTPADPGGVRTVV